MRSTSTSCLLLALAGACRSGDVRPLALRAEVPLHLEEHIADAVITGSDVPTDVPSSVEKYARFLEAKLAEHRELSEQFTPSSGSALTPDQLRALRELGYIP